MNPQRYSLRKVLWNDFPALAASVAIPIIWAILAGFPHLHRGAAPLPVWLPAGASLLMLAVLLWRIGRVHRLFASGMPAVGVITNLFISKDRGRLEFLFENGGQRVRAWMPIHRTTAVLFLAPGDPVDLLYDPAQPRRAIVKHLFVK